VQDEQTAVHLSSRLGDYKTVRLLVQHGADVNALMRDRYTPLHIAVKHEQLNVISELLSHAANIDVTSQVTHYVQHSSLRQLQPAVLTKSLQPWPSFHLKIICWATVCKTVRPVLSDRCPLCLSVCLSVCPVCL